MKEFLGGVYKTKPQISVQRIFLDQIGTVDRLPHQRELDRRALMYRMPALLRKTIPVGSAT